MLDHVGEHFRQLAVPGPGDVLRLEHVVKRYGPRSVLDDVSLTIPSDQYVSLLGPSGSGKTSLLRVIAGFERPEAGRIVLDEMPIEDVPAHRRGIGFVFQNFALFPHLSVRDNIAYGLVNRATPAADARARVEAIIALVGLGGLERRGVREISGGQRQRVALARTLVTAPRLVLLDEPLGALDANLRERMQVELREIRAKLGVTFLHVTGNETEALAMGDRTIVLDGGRVAQVDTPDRVHNAPASARVARFLNCYNVFEGTLSGDRFIASHGTFAIRSPVSPAARAARPAYAIRQDRVAIGAPDQQLAAGEAGAVARFVASEYSGPTIVYLFDLAGHGTVEVEDHLSHRAPRELTPGADYRLRWRDTDAVIFG